MSSDPAHNLLPIGGLVLWGTVNSLLSKVLYQLQGEGTGDQGVKDFRKPWASTFLMFFSMLWCLPVSQAALLLQKKRARAAQAREAAEEPLLSGQDQGGAGKGAAKKATSFKDTLIIIAPTTFDLIATLLMSVGLLYVSASIYQMLRGAEILFSAIFAVTLLKRSLNKFHYGGIAGCLLGVALVGASSLLTPSGKESSDAGQALLGMALIVLAQAVQAAQVTVEDYAMARIGLEPLTVVGWEGIYGTLISVAIMLPLAALIPGKDGDGLHEDSFDTLHMVTHGVPRWALPVVLLIQTVALLLYNISGMLVTEGLGAVTRTVLESARTLFVWLVDLGLFYAGDFGLGRLGEGWDRSSYLQLVGFAVLIAATLLYARGDQVHEKETEEHKGTERSKPHFRPHLSIASHSHTAIRTHRWRRQAAAAAQRARDALTGNGEAA